MFLLFNTLLVLDRREYIDSRVNRVNRLFSPILKAHQNFRKGLCM